MCGAVTLETNDTTPPGDLLACQESVDVSCQCRFRTVDLFAGRHVPDRDAVRFIEPDDHTDRRADPVRVA